jgi:hypothetical protein
MHRKEFFGCENIDGQTQKRSQLTLQLIQYLSAKETKSLVLGHLRYGHFI